MSGRFNKHLHAERGAAFIKDIEHASVVFKKVFLCPKPTLRECLTGASLALLACFAGWRAGLAPDLLP